MDTRMVVMPTIIVGVALYVILASFTDMGGVAESMRAFDLGLLGAVVALSLTNYVLRFWRWSLLLRDPATPVPSWWHFTVYLAGFALTTTPGKLGEAMRTFYLRPFGISHGRCLAALYAERLLDVVVISLLAMLIVVDPGPLTRWIGFIGAGLAVGLVALQHPAAVALLERLGERLAWRRLLSAIDAVTAFFRHVRAMLTARLVVLGTLTGLLAWGAEGLGTYLVAQALGVDIALPLAVGIYAAAMLAGALSFLPGGLGSTEVVMISLLIYAGATPQAAVAVTVIVRLATLWLAVMLGLCAWFGIETLRGPVPAGSGGMADRMKSHARIGRDTES